MRWVAVIAWVVVAGFYFSIFLSDEDKAIEELGPTAFFLLAAALIAVGGRIGFVAATLGVGLAALLAIVALALGRPPLLLAFVGLIVVNVLAVQEINRDRARPR